MSGDMIEDKKEEEKVFGGCEGPDAMYVKLISSDGHEFIVKREHALMSGTIKAMLSGPGQFAENETNEIHFREIPIIVQVQNQKTRLYKVQEANHVTIGETTFLEYFDPAEYESNVPVAKAEFEPEV